jgi:hypothetical protein
MVTRITPARRLSGQRVVSSEPRWWMGVLLGAPSLVAGLWVAVHQVPGFGPWFADSLRALVGATAVARLEDIAYGAEDRFNQLWRRGERPRAHWAVPVAAARPPRALRPSAEPVTPPFQPRDVGPVHEAWAAAGDGVWVALDPAPAADERVRMYKTLLHPDASRSWAELFVVAIELPSVQLELVPGTREPVATELEALELARPGVIPREHQARALAAFNGGFKTEHGRYGMRVQGVTIVAPHAEACAVAYFRDHRLKIASWPALAAEQSEMVWLRETPQCMYEDGQMHWRIAEGFTQRWGTTVDGDTVIQRSAIGIDPAGKTLFVGIGNQTTAESIARGMHHAGASSVAQLDVNFSYPKFVTFEAEPSAAGALPAVAEERRAVPLAEGFELSDDEYLRKPSQRDFFYLLPVNPDRRTAQK